MAGAYMTRPSLSALRLSVRTAAFHVAEAGSIPAGRATHFTDIETMIRPFERVGACHAISMEDRCLVH